MMDVAKTIVNWKAATAQAEHLAAARGWRICKKHFNLEQLIEASRNPKWGEPRHDNHYPEIDHAYYFRMPSSFIPVAILSHSYTSSEVCTAFARLHGLTVEVLPDSAYYPGHTLAVLYQRAA
jgi:hypothetical protein